MSIEPGEKLGPFEIVEPIGKGGMGEVYRARDTRLGRDVALKVSMQRFGERFEREARVISSLNHPNICTLHDVGENYLVMELVEGETLRDRIKQGPIPMEEALGFASQIAAALEAAHEKGVIHRDLKPGNVILKEDGTVKVLDFGLAKAGLATSGSSSGQDPELSPTISMAATQAGVVLGTAAYMAPEQARGKPVDKRADIWSFGVVLYEMVTGKKLFAGEDLTDTLAAVVRDKPDLSDAPAELQPLLNKCLEKDPRNRLRDIGGIDALLELGKAQAARQGAAPRPGRLGWIPFAGIAAAAALIAGLGAWLVKPTPAPPEPQVVRTTLDTGALLPDASVALSEDGRQVVYVTDEGLRVWPLNSFESTLIPGTVGARAPFFSPDGQQVAYNDTNSNNSLKRISVNGGPSGVIVEGGVNLGAKWMANGEILYASGTGIFQVSANGGEPRVIVEDTGGPTGFPQLMPDGNHIIYGINPGVPTREVILENLEDGTRRTLAIGAAGRYLETGERAGHVVFWTNQPTSQYLAIALDRDYAPVGAPFPLIDGIGVGAIAKVAVSASGTLVYQGGSGIALGAPDGLRTLTWVTPDGQETPIPVRADNYQYARVSPSGDRVAVQVGTEIWVWNVRNENFARLPVFGQPMMFPAWTPDGERIIFRAESDEGNAFYSIAADGSGEFQKVLDLPPGNAYAYNFTPDQSVMLATMQTPDGIRAFEVPMGSDWVATGEPRQLRESDVQVVEATVHPSGEWMAFAVLLGNGPATSFSPYPDAGRQEIPVAGFAQPAFSPSGDVLYMANAAQGLYSVDVDTADGLRLGTPEPLIANVYYWGALGRAWDIAPDGRFLLMKPQGAGAAPVEVEENPKLRVVVNWAEELKRLVPLPE